jgi:DNA topoisomerase-3
MKRFADSLARQKGIRPPVGYTKSGTICRAFLDQHARKKADGGPPGELGSKPASPAQMSLAENISRERGIVIPDESKANSAAMAAWIKSNLSTERGKGRRKNANKPAPKSPAPTKRPRIRNAATVVAPPTRARPGNRRSTCGAAEGDSA